MRGDEVIRYLQKNACCFNVYRDGNGLHLYSRVGSSVYDGKGLLLGPRRPFRNILLLK